MTCTGVDEDDCFPCIPLPPIQTKTCDWFGKEVKPLDKSHSLLQKGISPAAIPEKTDPAFYQREFVELMPFEPDEFDEEMEWAFAQAAPFIPAHFSKDMTLDEFLALTGFAFDQRLGQLIACRSWWKKAGHKIEKTVRKACKKTAKFVKKHISKTINYVAVKEIHSKTLQKIIKYTAQATVIVGAAVLAWYLAPYLAPFISGGLETLTAAGAAMLKFIKDALEQKGEKNASPAQMASDASSSRDKTTPYTPSTDNSRFMEMVFGDTFKKETPSAPRSFIYKVEPERSNIPPSSQNKSAPFVPPSSSRDNIVGRFFNDLLKPPSTPHSGIYKLEKDLWTIPPLQTPYLTPASPQANIPPSLTAVDGKQSLTAFLEKVRQGLEIIGRGSDAAKAQTPSTPFKSSFETYLENLQRCIIDPQYQSPHDSGIGALQGDRNIERGSGFDTFVDTLKQELGSIETDGEHEASFLERTDKAICHFLDKFAGAGETFSRGALAPDLVSEVPYPPDTGTSRYYVTQGKDIDGMLETCCNGINNTFEVAKSNAEHIQSLSSKDIRIHGIYNHSNGPFVDLVEVGFFNYSGYSPVTAALLKNKWTEFHEKYKHNPYARILHFCHSKGAIDTKNALMQLPEDVRNRVIVVALAPAEVVPRELCYDSFNYASKLDIVPYGEVLHGSFRAASLGDEDRMNLLNQIAENQKQIIWLDPVEGASGLDHAVQGPIFIEIIKKHLEDYELNMGQYK